MPLTNEHEPLVPPTPPQKVFKGISNGRLTTTPFFNRQGWRSYSIDTLLYKVMDTMYLLPSALWTVVTTFGMFGMFAAGLFVAVVLSCIMFCVLTGDLAPAIGRERKRGFIGYLLCFIHLRDSPPSPADSNKRGAKSSSKSRNKPSEVRTAAASAGGSQPPSSFVTVGRRRRRRCRSFAHAPKPVRPAATLGLAAPPSRDFAYERRRRGG